MTLRELVERFRTAANDKVEPYFWQDAEVVRWLNDGLAEAVLRGRLLHDSLRIGVTAGQRECALPALWYEWDGLCWEAGGKRQPLCLLSPEEAGRLPLPPTGLPRYAVQYDTGLRLLPVPDTDGEIWGQGYRFARHDLANDDDVPEIHAAHHRYLVEWALHQAFGVPDAEVFDAARSALALQRFTEYFGLPVDSDLRRITREDVPHTVKAFWV